jgi:hypothetical protein
VATETYERGEPCTRCGESVTVIEATSEGRRPGRRLRPAPQIAMKHTDDARRMVASPVDDGCTREIGPNA